MERQTKRELTMVLKVQLSWNVVVSAESLYEDGAMLRRSIVRNLLDEFSERKAAEDVEYFVAITTLDNIGVGKIRPYGEVEFPVEFSAITFKLLKGEVVQGVVKKVKSFGVHLACGPADEIFLSKKRMPEYHYVAEDNPMFLNDSTSAKIEKDDVVRIRVIGTQWLPELMDFRAVVGFPAGEE